MTLAIVCVLPVPGGPCTTTPINNLHLLRIERLDVGLPGEKSALIRRDVKSRGPIQFVPLIEVIEHRNETLLFRG